RRGLDTADVDDLGPFGHDLRDPVEGLVLGPGGALVVEGVGGPVHDRHHQRGVVGERAAAEPQRHRGYPVTVRAGGLSVTSTTRVSGAIVPATGWYWRRVTGPSDTGPPERC